MTEQELTIIVAPLLAWYDKKARILPWREYPTPYRVWLSEIMLQQTRVEAVKPFFDRFFAEAPDIASLAALSEDKLLKLWEGLGYYNRARNLKKAAQQIILKFNGKLPASYEQLLSLPGIGEYTAGAIASIAYGIPVPAVDGNVLRVLARLLAYDGDILSNVVKRHFRVLLQNMIPQQRAGDFNQALMELGATVCLPNGMPRCADCPLQAICRANAEGTVLAFPVKKVKNARRIEDRTVFLLYQGDKIAIHKREAKGLLAGLWEFPNITGLVEGQEIVKYLETIGLVVEKFFIGKKAKHVFTHIEWHMQSYDIMVRGEAKEENWLWVKKDELEEKYSLPTAFRIFFE